MGFVWKLYAIRMSISWSSPEHPMVISWDEYGKTMERLWKEYGTIRRNDAPAVGISLGYSVTTIILGSGATSTVYRLRVIFAPPNSS